eukprot:1158684-Pelagomonas_calceolata.AAC.1
MQYMKESGGHFRTGYVEVARISTEEMQRKQRNFSASIQQLKGVQSPARKKGKAWKLWILPLN